MKSTLKQGSIILGMMVVVLVLLEGIGRLAVWYLESRRTTGIFGEEILDHNEPVLGFGLKKNLDIQLGHWRAQTTSLGFRDQPFPEKKPEDEFRVFVVGGSTVFGWGAWEQDTIPSMLEKRMQEFFTKHNIQKKLRVINAGVPWYSSWHEAATIFFRLMPLEPDWIIVMDGLNDVAQGILPNWNPIHLGYQDLPTTIANQRKYAQKNFFMEILRLSPSFRYFHARWTAREQIKVGVYQPKIWDQYENYMTWLAALTESQGIRFSVYLQPVIAVEYEPNETEMILNASTLKSPTFASTFRKVYLEGVERFTGTNKFRFHSLHALFKDMRGEFLYFDGLHYTGKANWTIAQEIYKHEVEQYLTARFLKVPPVAIRKHPKKG